MRSSRPGPREVSRRPHGLSHLGDRIAWYASAIGLERWARVVAVTVVPLLLPDLRLAANAVLYAGLVGYVLVTALAPRNRTLRAADLLVSAIVVVVAGTDVVSFLPFLLVAVAGPASRGGPRAGAAAGLALSLLLLVRLALEDGTAALDPVNAVSLALLLPLTGLTTAAAAQVLDDRAVRDRLVLHEANRLLASLRALAEDLPGGLDTATVCAALVTEARAIAGVRQVIVYADEHGIHRPAATSGVPSILLPTLRIDVLRDLVGQGRGVSAQRSLPEPLHRACEASPQWVARPIGSLDELRGVLLAGFDSAEAARAARPRLATIAQDGAVALDNVRLFDGTLVRATDAARRRVASDLHDGVAQALAHLRMELELLALTADGAEGDEARRLARVATSALEDLRRTIRGLRTPLSDGLDGLLRGLVDDVGGPHGPTLTLHTSGDLDLDPGRAEEVVRVAQEAVSNALRHASADEVVITLAGDEDGGLLRIEDDGVGRSGTTTRRGDGVGMRSMRERAQRLHGRLEIGDRAGGGTVVTLRFPLHDAPTPSTR